MEAGTYGDTKGAVVWTVVIDWTERLQGSLRMMRHSCTKSPIAAFNIRGASVNLLRLAQHTAYQ